MHKIASAFNRCREMGFEDRTFFVFDNTDFSSTLKHVVMPRLGLRVEVRDAPTDSTKYPTGIRDGDQRGVFCSERISHITPQFTNHLHRQWERSGEFEDFRVAFGDNGSSSSRSTTEDLRSFDMTVLDSDE